MIEGMDKLLERLEKIENVSLKEPIARVTEYVQSVAKLGCPVHDGELRESILAAQEQNGDTEIGICYTNKEYGPYVEFGTGPLGQENHKGISPNIPVAYTQSPWWIHESQIDKRAAEQYHWFYLDTPEGRFYQCTGQAAHPFMYPALKDNEEQVTDMIMDDIRRQLK